MPHPDALAAPPRRQMTGPCSLSRTAPAPSVAGKRYCREMTNCEEARFYLNTCGVGSLDGNRDGVPCAKLCR